MSLAKKIACFFLLISLAFTTHKYYLSLTQIEYNKSQKSLEVIINVFMDDIELAINKEYAVNLNLTTKEELKDVLDECGFEIDQLDHKFKYSYTAICKKKSHNK